MKVASKTTLTFGDSLMFFWPEMIKNYTFKFNHDAENIKKEGNENVLQMCFRFHFRSILLDTFYSR